MAKVIAGMTMSLDGFVNDRHGSIDRLYPDLERLHGTEYMNAMIEATGAVIIGRGDPPPTTGRPEAGRAADVHVRDRRHRTGGGTGEIRCGRQGGPGHRRRQR